MDHRNDDGGYAETFPIAHHLVVEARAKRDAIRTKAGETGIPVIPCVAFPFSYAVGGISETQPAVDLKDIQAFKDAARETAQKMTANIIPFAAFNHR